MGSRPSRVSSTATRIPRSPATAPTSSRSAPAVRATRSSSPPAAGSSRRPARRGRRARPSSSRSFVVTGTRCSPTARRRSRERAATGSTATPSSRSSQRSRQRAACPTWLGAHAVPPEQPDADAYVDWAIREVLPDAARIAVAADVFVERGTFDVEQARRYLEACRGAGLALRLHGDQLSEIGAVPLAIELGARSVDHLEATGPAGVAALAASDVVGVLLPVAALYLARPMPPARALVDAGAAIALATDFNPGSAYCESLPVVVHARVHAARAHPRGSARRVHGQCRARPRSARPRPDRARSTRRPRPARRARLAAPRLPPCGRRRAHRHPGEGASRSRGHNSGDGESEAARRRAKEKRHEYDLVEIDEEGNETVLCASELKAEAPAKAATKQQGPRGTSAQAARGARRNRRLAAVLKRGAIFAPIFLATVLLLGGDRMTLPGRGRPDAVPARDLRAVQLLHGPPRLALAREAAREDIGSLRLTRRMTP